MANKTTSWQHDIDFQCSFGLPLFKRTLNISPKGFEWCGELIPLKQITGLRWGVDLVRGGVFKKRVYVAAFSTDTNEHVIKTRDQDFYDHLTQRFWKAVGRRLLSEMLDGLAAGKVYQFDAIAVEDKGVTITNKQMFSTESKFYPWADLRWGTISGYLSFATHDDPEKILAGTSFLWTKNVHMFNVALGMLPHAKDKTKLSSTRDQM